MYDVLEESLRRAEINHNITYGRWESLSVFGKAEWVSILCMWKCICSTSENLAVFLGVWLVNGETSDIFLYSSVSPSSHVWFPGALRAVSQYVKDIAILLFYLLK